MRKTLVVLAVLLLLAVTSAAQGKRKSWLHGSWEGTGYQTDDQSTWPMKLTIRRSIRGRRAFSIDYPSLSCGGHWQLLSMSQAAAKFREILDHGQDKCSDKGLVMIERRGAQLIFLYSNEGTHEITASAVLNRRSRPKD